MLPAVALMAAGTAGLGFAQLMPQARAAEPLGVLVVGGDGASLLRVIAAADGRLVTFGGWSETAIAVSDDPAFAEKLYRAGASFVFRAEGAMGCPDADLQTPART